MKIPPFNCDFLFQKCKPTRFLAEFSMALCTCGDGILKKEEQNVKEEGTFFNLLISFFGTNVESVTCAAENHGSAFDALGRTKQ